MTSTRGTRWTRCETTTIVRAVRNAPVLWPEQPWVLQMPGRTVELYEQTSGERHDSGGLDRLLSCGAALANAVLSMRALGWYTLMHVGAVTAEPDLAARISTVQRRPPTEPELLLYEQSRQPVEAGQRPDNLADLGQLADITYFPGARLELVSDRPRAAALARVLLDARRQLDGDQRCAKELAPWCEAGRRIQSTVYGGGYAVATMTEPYADAICAVAAELIAQPMFAVVTDGDDRVDHILAGAAMQIGCLTGTRLGFAMHPVAWPMHLRQVRRRLRDDLGLSGFPQALIGVTRSA